MPFWLTNHLTAWFAHYTVPAPTADRPILAAVSGGGDSMALAYGLADAFGPSAVEAAIVDHGMRQGSAAEARWTRTQLEGAGISSTVYTLPNKPSDAGNVQAWARAQRYRVFAQQLQCSAIATAHTLEDQAETVLARLARASGTRGLSAMRPVSSLATVNDDEQLLVRPLLDIHRDDLRSYLTDRGIRWAEDPSNHKTRFDRVRLRRLLNSWSASGFAPDRIAASAAHLARSQDALQYYTDQAWDNLVQRDGSGVLAVQLPGFAQLPDDIQLRLLQRLLCEVGRAASPPRFEKLERAWHKIRSGQAASFTLHDTHITVERGAFTLRPEG